MKILYLGNSITLHSPNTDIGWHGNWGMAASSEEKDYVHVLDRMIEETGVTVEHLVDNIADFERAPDTFDFAYFDKFRDWQPDVLILRICENTPEEKVDAFGVAYEKLIRYFQREGLTIYAVGPFWGQLAKENYIRQAAENTGVPFVTLKALYTQDFQKYQAIGLFEHAGVAAHPSDTGMQAIAESIFAAMQESK